MPVADVMINAIESSSLIRKMFEEGAKLKAEYGEDKVFDFSLGNPDVPPPPELTKVLRELVNSNNLSHGYMPNPGYPHVRQAHADYLSKTQNVNMTSELVLMTGGASAGLNSIFKAMLNPGDQVIVSAPYFVEYGRYVNNYRGELITVNARSDFQLDLEKIEEAINEKTRIILINSPNNPTGAVYTEEILKGLSAIMCKASKKFGKRIYLVSDEPYRRIAYEQQAPPIMSIYRNTIMVTSYSKELSLAGERIGYLAVHPEAEDAVMIATAAGIAARELGFVNAPSLMQLAVAKLQGVCVDVSIYKRRRDMLTKGLAEIGYDFVMPQGAFYLFPRSPLPNEIDFVNLLKDERILVVPGSAFGGPGHFRISYAVPDSTIEGSMEGFKRAFERV